MYQLIPVLAIVDIDGYENIRFKYVAENCVQTVTLVCTRISRYSLTPFYFFWRLMENFVNFRKYNHYKLNTYLVVLSGLVVSMLAIGLKVRRFKPG
jgi:hypothetical protein